MRFIVDLYKYIIFAMCGLVVIGVSLVIIFTLDNTIQIRSYTPIVLISSVSFVILVVLALGGTAMLVSLHERHAEMAEALERLAVAAETITEREATDVRIFGK